MQSARLIASCLRHCETSAACGQCWALIRSASSSSLPAAAVAATSQLSAVGPQWSTLGQLHTFGTSTVQAAATATAAQPAAAEQGASADSQQGAGSLQQPPQQKQQQQQQKAQQQTAPPQQAPQISFDDLRKQYQQQLTLRNIRDEDNLLILVNSARTADQVKAALDMLRWDKMVRARQQQRYSHYSTKAIRALLRVGRKAQMGPSFSVQLLEEADELGLQVSLVACEDVLDHCISKHDYFAAAEAWVYTRVYCADPSRKQPEAAPAAAGREDSAAQEQQQQQDSTEAAPAAAGQEESAARKQREGPLGWASNSLMRLYARGLVGWLKQGCVSRGHEQFVKQQLQELLRELESRGAAFPNGYKLALEATAFPAAAAATEAAGTAPDHTGKPDEASAGQAEPNASV